MPIIRAKAGYGVVVTDSDGGSLARDVTSIINAFRFGTNGTGFTIKGFPQSGTSFNLIQDIATLVTENTATLETDYPEVDIVVLSYFQKIKYGGTPGTNGTVGVGSQPSLVGGDFLGEFKGSKFTANKLTIAATLGLDPDNLGATFTVDGQDNVITVAYKAIPNGTDSGLFQMTEALDA